MIAYREHMSPRRKRHLSLGAGFARTLCGRYLRGRGWSDMPGQVKLSDCWGVDEDDCVRCAATYRRDRTNMGVN